MIIRLRVVGVEFADGCPGGGPGTRLAPPGAARRAGGRKWAAAVAGGIRPPPRIAAANPAAPAAAGAAPRAKAVDHGPRLGILAGTGRPATRASRTGVPGRHAVEQTPGPPPRRPPRARRSR
ncbi:hypothetical protein ACFQ5X_48010, partial [Streptomyces kaempferi]